MSSRMVSVVARSSYFACRHDVDVIAGQQESRHADHVVDADGHGAHVRPDQRGQRAAGAALGEALLEQHLAGQRLLGRDESFDLGELREVIAQRRAARHGDRP